jgi:hypothetical protein
MRRPLVPMITLVAQITPDNLFLLRRLLDQVQLFAVMPIELRLVQLGTSVSLERFVDELCHFGMFANVDAVRVDDGAMVEKALSAQARAAAGEYVMFVRPNVVVHRGFDYFLHKTFLANPQALALTPVSTLEGEAHRDHFARESLDGLTQERASYQFINWHRGETIADFKSPDAPPVVIFRASLVSKLPDAFFTGLAGLANSGHLKVAPSVCISLVPSALIQQMVTYLRSSGAERRTLALDALKSQAFLVFPDVAAQLVPDLLTAGAKAHEVAPIIDVAILGRHGDLETLKDLRRAVARQPALTRPLDERIDLIARYRHAVGCR